MSQEVKQIRIQSRVDTKENWESENPILLNKEIGYERETGKYKIGDGVNTWLHLLYSTVGNEGATVEQLNSKVDKIQGKNLSTNDFTDDYKNKVDNLNSIIDTKVDKVSGKGLSTNDFTNDYKNKVDNTENLINGRIADLVDSAPEALDTLGELSEAIKQHEDAYDALLEVVGNKADKSEVNNIINNADTNPIENSKNLVTSGGVYKAIQEMSKKAVDSIILKSSSSNSSQLFKITIDDNGTLRATKL